MRSHIDRDALAGNFSAHEYGAAQIPSRADLLMALGTTAKARGE